MDIGQLSAHRVNKINRIAARAHRLFDVQRKADFRQQPPNFARAFRRRELTPAHVFPRDFDFSLRRFLLHPRDNLRVPLRVKRQFNPRRGISAVIYVQARVQFSRRIQHPPQHVHRVRPLPRRPPENSFSNAVPNGWTLVQGRPPSLSRVSRANSLVYSLCV